MRSCEKCYAQEPGKKAVLIAGTECGHALQTSVKRSFDYAAGVQNEWDDLVSRSTSSVIFQTSEWLRASIDSYCDSSEVLVPEVRRNGILVGAAALRQRNGVVEFAGIDRSDMCDLLLARDLSRVEAMKVLESLLKAAKKASTRFRCFHLRRIPLESLTVQCMLDPCFGYFTRVQGYSVAPSMEMAAAGEKLRKKHLRSLESRLQRAGALESRTFSRAADIFPRLDAFFEQHIKRWAKTSSPSLFLDKSNREFYRRMLENLDSTGWLRFTVLELDGRTVSAHLGFMYARRFCWYKPTFDIEFAKYSPGQVLMKRAIEQAAIEGADEFDFLLGDEAYKRRYATRVRKLVSLEIHPASLGVKARHTWDNFTDRLHNIAGRCLGRN